jgi:hypothetical protein
MKRQPEERSRWSRRVPTVLAAMLVMLTVIAQGALAVTQVTVNSTVALKAVGPTSSVHGFPAWYQDSTGLRLEPCLDGDNPECGFLPGDIPDPDAPISFPGNFPEEFFYFLAGSTLDLPGGGRAVLTSGLEAAFLNGVNPGEQVTFSRVRVVVRGGPANQTITVRHPYGELTIDLDNTGSGRLVRDIAPSIGNFSLALKGDVGPFLRWTGTDAPPGHIGDPAITHTVTGGPARNTFELAGQNGATIASTDQFTLQGKIATNTGVTVDSVTRNDGFVDVFASTSGSALEVVGQSGKFPTTIMSHDPGSERFYARVPIAAGQTVTDVVVRNNGDNPASTATAKVSGITVTQAGYDGTNLVVAATASGPAAYPLTIAGFPEQITSAAPVTIAVTAPPAAVTVSSGGLSASLPVTITGGPASPEGTTAPPVGPPAPPVCDPAPCAADVAPTARVAANPLTAVRGTPIVIDASRTTAATSYSTVLRSGTATITNGTTDKPSVTLPTWVAPADTAPKPNATTPTAMPATDAVVTFTATNASGSSSVDVTIKPAVEAFQVTAARYRPGSDLRVDGTSTIQGAGLVLTPPTQVVLWVKGPATGDPWVKMGSAAVDTTGAWSVRPRPAPTANYTQYLVQSSRGGSLTGTLAR